MNFTTPRYAILFLNSEIYIVHVINHEWNMSIFVASAMCFVWDAKPNFPTTSGTSSHEKHLENFLKVFLSSVLAVGPGDFLVTWLSRKKSVFCVLWSIFLKNFLSFSLDYFVTIHCLPCLNLFQNHSVHTQILIFSIFSIPLHQSSSKGICFVSFSICVTYLVIYLLDCVFLLYIW